MKTEQKTLVAMVQTWSAKLFPSVNYGPSNDIEVVIATLEPGKDYPRNFSPDFFNDPKTSTGGCFCRVWAHDSTYSEGIQANYFGAYGPAISNGDTNDYKHALRALQVIEKRTTKMHEARGHAVDAADCLGRWLEACGVTQVYMRPDSSRGKSWLNEGEWHILSVGEFVSKVRGALYVKPATITPEAVNG